MVKVFHLDYNWIPGIRAPAAETWYPSEPPRPASISGSSIFLVDEGTEDKSLEAESWVMNSKDLGLSLPEILGE